MENKGTVLLVEDNKGLNDANARALRMRGYSVLTAENLAQARERLSELEPDVILLDVMLPDGSGFDFCAEIREKISAYIIFLTAKASHEDMVRGMTGGGDAYITKPFHVQEMLVKVDAAIGRMAKEKTPAETLTFGSLTLDVVASKAFINDVSIGLTPKEFSLLYLFYINKGQILNADYIYERIWKMPLNQNTGALRFQISSLRKKLEGSGYTIEFNQAGGYCFEQN